MDSYKIFFKKSVEKELRRISNPFLRQLVRKIQTLSSNPKPVGAQMLKGENRYFRIKQGDYRIIYEVREEEQIIEIIKVGHRREVYD